MKVRFGICADLHCDFIHDSVERAKIFIDECKEKNVDFCVELGDFCPPGDMNLSHKEKIIDMIKNCNIPFYHTYGNHDEDHNTKDAVRNYIDADKTNVSFDVGGVHFIIADACYYMQDGIYHSYDMGNYKNASADALLPVLPPCELERIKKELDSTTLPTVIFSHQSLIESRAGIVNADEFRQAVSGRKSKVLMSICGHEHVDRLEQKDGIYYYCLNSMSYYWAGENYTHLPYGGEVEKDYPLMKYVFPYKDPIYAIIEIDDDEITVDGKTSEIVGETPESMNFEKKGLVDKITAEILSRKIKF